MHSAIARMKPTALFLICLPALSAPRTAASDQALSDFGLGSGIGLCLSTKCDVFSGPILTDSPKSGEPIFVSVEDALVGIWDNTKIVAVPFETPRNGDGNEIGSAWRGAETSKNSPVTVVIARESVWPFRPGLPVIVTSSQHDVEIIRSLTAKAQELRSSPERIWSIVASLHGNSNPSLTGFALGFIRGAVANRGPYSRAQVASLHLDLLRSVRTLDPRIISSVFGALFPIRLTTFYPDSTAATQIEMVQTLVEYAQSKDPYVARDALSELSVIADTDKSFQTVIPPSSISGLQKAYRESVDKGRTQPSAALEERTFRSQIGAQDAQK